MAQNLPVFCYTQMSLIMKVMKYNMVTNHYSSTFNFISNECQKLSSFIIEINLEFQSCVRSLASTFTVAPYT